MLECHDVNKIASTKNNDIFFVFMVGINSEWEQGRVEFGDVALYDTYHAVGIPTDHIVFLKDLEATKSNCEEKLKNLLTLTVVNSTLIFYYGGHGHPTGFETLDEDWQHENIIQLIDSYFKGDRVILMADCCAAGNTCKYLQHPLHPLRHAYLCLMSCPPYQEAGPAWTMTRSLIEAIMSNDGTMPLHKIASYLADETVVEKGDLLTVYLSPDADPTTTSWLPSSSPEQAKRRLEWKHPTERLPPDAKITSHCAAGNLVFYKHPGGVPVAGGPYIMPVWLPGKISSRKNHDCVILSVKDPLYCVEWQVSISPEEVLNQFHMAATWVVPKAFYQVQCDLATNFKYFDFSLTPGTHVRVRWSDGQLYNARIMDWREVDWEDCLLTGICDEGPPYGAHAAVWWTEEDTYSIVSRANIVVPSNLREFDASSFQKGSMNILCANERSEKMREAILNSIRSCGKNVKHGNEIFGTKELSCFWPNGEWYDAVALNPKECCLRIFASHAWFTPIVDYCPVLFCEDGSDCLVPVCYLKPRMKSKSFCCQTNH